MPTCLNWPATLTTTDLLQQLWGKVAPGAGTCREGQDCTAAVSPQLRLCGPKLERVQSGWRGGFLGQY